MQQETLRKSRSSVLGCATLVVDSVRPWRQARAMDRKQPSDGSAVQLSFLSRLSNRGSGVRGRRVALGRFELIGLRCQAGLFAGLLRVTVTEPKYDVAISFLSGDVSVANALFEVLSAGLRVFCYPRNQEQLAGTNGLESMRKPFDDDSRLVVVLYREAWGNTPWTRVESTAIQDGCLNQGWQRLFFLMLDNTSAPPAWLPETQVRFNYADFGFEQAVGAIKARVQERGGTIVPLTAVRRAELARQETEYLKAKKRLQSWESREEVQRMACALFTGIKGLCEDINAAESASISFKVDARECHLRSSRVSLIVFLDLGSLGPSLTAREFDCKVPFPGERTVCLGDEMNALSNRRFLPDLTRGGEYGWMAERQAGQYLSCDALADSIVSRFVDLAAKADRGQLKRPMAPRGIRLGRGS